MPDRAAQSTDAENNRSPLKVGKPGDDTKTISTKSAQMIAREAYTDSPVVGAGTGSDIIAPEQS
jgi:hypothetical protein